MKRSTAQWECSADKGSHSTATRLQQHAGTASDALSPCEQQPDGIWHAQPPDPLCSEYKRWQRASASQGRAPASNSSKMTLNKMSPKPTASPLKGHRQIRAGDASRTARCCCAQPCVQPAAPAHSSAKAPLRTASCWEGHWGKGVTRIQTNTFTHAHSDKQASKHNRKARGIGHSWNAGVFDVGYGKQLSP